MGVQHEEEIGGYSERETGAIRALRHHLIERGAFVSDGIACAEFVSSDGSLYRGVRALRDLDRDELLVSIPEPLLLSVRSAKRDPDIQRAIRITGPDATRIEFTDQQLLAVHLLHEASKGTASSHHAYLQTLPLAFDNFLYLSDAAVDSLGVSHCHAARVAAQSKAQFLKSFRGAQPLMRALNLPDKLTSLNAYRWTVSCIKSRTMFMTGDTVGCLTPYGDLHNHAPKLQPVTLWNYDDKNGQKEQDEQEESAVAGEGFFDEAQQRYQVVTRVRLSAGQQVFLTYGRLTNLDLFGLYGFVLDHNAWDTSVIPRAQLPERIQRHVSQEACFLHANGCPSFELMRGIRLGVLKDKERKRWASVILDDRGVVKGDCERRAVEALRTIVGELLDREIQAREHAMETSTSFRRDSLIWQWRRSQTIILETCLGRLK